MNSAPLNPSQFRWLPESSKMPIFSPDIETGELVYRILPAHLTCHTRSVSDIISETESSVSARTIESDDISEYFVLHHGRQQPMSENAIRWFPADSSRRYIMGHMLRKWVSGRNYIGPVREMLNSRPRTGRQHRVLEIGTRHGTWTQDMATEFPHVQFLSLDIAPIAPHTPRANVVFEVYDITEGLLVEENSQDIVFINGGAELVKNYRILLREARRVLRKGGLIHIHEYLPGFWDSQNDSRPAWRTNPVGCSLYDLVRFALTESGADPDTTQKIPQWLSPGSDLWPQSNEPSGFESIRTAVTPFPVFPHDNHSCSSKLNSRISQLMIYFSTESIKGSYSLLRDAGLSDERATSLINNTIEELKNPNNCPLFKVYDICATKRG